MDVAARNPQKVQSLVFAEALFPGFGFEQHTALTPENVSGLFLWHLGFYFQPDVPEMLISGHERELITYMIKNERIFPDTATPEVIEEYVRCYSMPGGISIHACHLPRDADGRGTESPSLKDNA